MSEKSPKNIKNTCKTNIYKFRANSKKAQQVNPSPFKSAQVPWTYFFFTSHILRSLRSSVCEGLKSLTLDRSNARAPRIDQITLIPENSPLPFISVWRDRSTKLTVEHELSTWKNSSAELGTMLSFSDRWKRSVHLQLHVSNRSIPLSSNYPSVHSVELPDDDYVSKSYLPSMFGSFPQIVSLFLSNFRMDPVVTSTFVAAVERLTKLSTLDISNSSAVGGYLGKLLRNGFPALRTLVMSNCKLESVHLSFLAVACVEGKLPNLSTLDISRNPFVGRNLSALISQIFPKLHTLVLSACSLNFCDVLSLVAQMQHRLPQLRHLDLSFYKYSLDDSKYVLSTLLSRLSTLVLRKCGLNNSQLYSLCELQPEGGYFAELTTLDLSDNPGISGCLSLLLCHYFPKLNILIFRKCFLNQDDMTSLAHAVNCGKLPELRHLDLSLNKIGWESTGLLKLLVESEIFPMLINLILCWCKLEVQDLDCLRQAKLDGKLPRIRHLDISLNGLFNHMDILSRDPIT